MLEVHENERGYLTYQYNSQQQQDHPKLARLLEEISKKSSHIKYFTYRVASKLFDLQRCLLKGIPYQLVLGILDRHKLSAKSHIQPAELCKVLVDIYGAAERLGYQAKAESSRLLVLNLLWNIFDPKRQKSITLMEFKVFMLTLCETSGFQASIREFFDLSADHNQCVSRGKFEALLQTFGRVFSFFDESANQFGVNWMGNTVRDAFESSPGLVGLTEFQFEQLWYAIGSNFANFSSIVALIQRLKESQYVLHGAICANCRSSPIRGLRFKCQSCKKLSLCLDCFSRGFSNHKHKISHKMFEICRSEDRLSRRMLFWTKLMSLFGRGQRNNFDNGEIKLVETTSDDILDLGNSTNVKISSHSTVRSRAKSVYSTIGRQTDTRDSLSAQLLQVVDSLEVILSRIGNELEALRLILGDRQLSPLQTEQKALQDTIALLKSVSQQAFSNRLPVSSTPYKGAKKRPKLEVFSPLAETVYGAEINKSFVDRNRSDFSVRDLSTWFAQEADEEEERQRVKEATFIPVETKMANFKRLLTQVRALVDDSGSENTELAFTTQQLERALDELIVEEEKVLRIDV